MPDPENPVPSWADSNLPGDFVSNDLRVDCERFLHELRNLVALRRAQHAETDDSAGEPDE
jgi:hypothetical protein